MIAVRALASGEAVIPAPVEGLSWIRRAGHLRTALGAVAKVPEQGLRLARGMPTMVVGGRQLWPKRLRS